MCTWVITKMNMNKTIVIRRDYLHYAKKYNRLEKRHKNMSMYLQAPIQDSQGDQDRSL